jgi:hypothetical protein
MLCFWQDRNGMLPNFVIEKKPSSGRNEIMIKKPGFTRVIIKDLTL